MQQIWGDLFGDAFVRSALTDSVATIARMVDAYGTSWNAIVVTWDDWAYGDGRSISVSTTTVIIAIIFIIAISVAIAIILPLIMRQVKISWIGWEDRRCNMRAKAEAWDRLHPKVRNAGHPPEDRGIMVSTKPEKPMVSIEFLPVQPIQDTQMLQPVLDRLDAQDTSPVQAPKRKVSKTPTYPGGEASLGDVAQFSEDRAERKIGSRIQATPLYNEYSNWCARRRKKAVTQYAFGLTMKELGFKKERMEGKVMYLDIALKNQAHLKVVKA